MKEEDRSWMSAYTSWKKTQEMLDQLMVEVTAHVVEKEPSTKEKEEKAKARRRAGLPTDEDNEAARRPGREELRRAVIGVLEEMELEEADKCRYNKMHDEKGRFSSKNKRGSWSALSPECDKRGQHRRAKGMSKPGADSSVCGRQNPDKLCKTGRKRRNESLVTREGSKMDLDRFQEMIAQIVRTELLAAREQAKKIKSGPCSLGSYLKTQNALAKSEKGTLGKKSKG